MHNLSQKEKDFLEEIKKEKNGVPFSAAHTMINPNNDLNGDNQQIISELIAKKLLEIVIYEGIKYLRVPSLASGDEQEYDTKQYGYEVIGLPHSPIGMISLKKEFYENLETLYLILGTTSYEMFKDILEIRMSKGYKTVFIYPAFNTVRNDKREHYKVEKKKWEQYLMRLPQIERKTVEFRIANKDYTYIKNSMFTRDHARINVRVENSNSSSRNGIILRCENNNTIYRMAEKSYEDIVFNSHIDIKVNLAKFLVEFLKQNIIKIILIVVFLGICIFLPNANGAFWGFLTGLISDMIIEWVKEIKWKKKKLFEN